MLLDTIKEAMTRALKEKNALKVSALRFLLAQIKNAEIDAKDHALKDEDVLKIIAKQVKQRAESIEAFKKGGRAELAEKEAQELAILKEYMPAQLNEAELTQKIKDIIAELGASGKKDFGKVMKESVSRLAGSAEPQAIKKILDTLLK
jgi:hypothetical protein